MKKVLLTAVATLSLAAATIAQNVPNYVPTNGLIGWWPFNGNANDESGNNNNGTVNGATLTSDRNGNNGKAYSFDAFNWGWGSGGDYIYIPYNQIYNSQQLTVSVWFKKSSTYITNQVNPSLVKRFEFGYNNPNGQSWGLYVNTNGDSLGTFLLPPNTSNNYTVSISQIGPNVTSTQWHNAIMTFDGLNMKTYFDGQLISSKPANGMLLNTNSNSGISVGMSLQANGHWDPFNGSIDDIGIWNRALTQQEITNLYNPVNCNNNLAITPQTNTLQIGNTATFNATTSDATPSFVWQSDFGQGFVTLNNYGNYSGVNTNTLSIANVQLANHNQPIRAISTSGICVDTSNVAYINIADTCITTVYDTVTTYISVTDTLFININTVGLNNNTIINTIKVYPNPANSHLNLDFDNFNNLNGYSIKIYNSLSQVIYNQAITQQSETIDLSTFGGNGIYFLHVINAQNNTVEIRKIVLQ